MLGAMLINPDTVGAAIEVLGDTPEDVFYVEAHQHIYDAVLGLFRSNTPVDATTLTERLTRNNLLEKTGGFSYLADLSGAVPTSANIEYYAKMVLETGMLRRLISTCTAITSTAYEGAEEVTNLLDRAEADIFALAQKRQVNPIHDVRDLLQDGVKRIETQMQTGAGITGLATGFTKLDEMLSGLQPSDMIVLAARPSVGKTAFALNMGAHIANELGKGVLLFSLEMAKEQLVQRLLCMVGRVDSQRLRTGFLARNEFPKVQEAAGILSKASIYIDESANISVMDLRSKARRHAAQHPLDVIVIDYLQLMRGSSSRSENRQVEIAEISRSIKGIARELSVPVVALSQLSREAEKDDTGMPKLSHLRESGAIEQDADVVLFLSRLPAHQSEGRENVIVLQVAKQRNGPTGKMELLFERNIQRFMNLAGDGAPAPPPDMAPSAFDGPVDYDDSFEEDNMPFEEDDTPF